MEILDLGLAVGPGVPTGGTANQVLAKNGSTNFDTSWKDAGTIPSIANVQDGLAIVANGNTHAAIASGQFVYVKNHSSLSEGLYRATAAISANGALSTSNLTADGSGGLNALKADVDTLNSNLAKSETTDVSTATGVTKIGFNAKKQLKVVYVKGTMQKTLTLNTWNLLCTLPAGYRPSELLECAFINGTMDNSLHGKIESNGELSVYPTSNNSSASVANILFYATFIN